MLRPTPGEIYATHEEVRAMLDSYARDEGFAVSVRASNRINYRWQCVHGGKYRNTRKLPEDPDDGEGVIGNESGVGLTAGHAHAMDLEPVLDPALPKRHRLQTSKRTNCPWLVRAGLDGNNYWKITKVVLEHNHSLSPHDPTVYHQNRVPTQRPERRRERKSRIDSVEYRHQQQHGHQHLPLQEAIVGPFAAGGLTNTPQNYFVSGQAPVESVFVTPAESMMPLPGHLEMVHLTPRDYAWHVQGDDDDDGKGQVFTRSIGIQTER